MSDCQSDSDTEVGGDGDLDTGSDVAKTTGLTGSSGSPGASGSTHDHPLASLQEKLKELNTAYNLVVKNSHQLTKFASELESGASKSNAGKPKEKFALLKITSAAIVKVSVSTRDLVS